MYCSCNVCMYIYCYAIESKKKCISSQASRYTVCHYIVYHVHAHVHVYGITYVVMCVCVCVCVHAALKIETGLSIQIAWEQD